MFLKRLLGPGNNSSSNATNSGGGENGPGDEGGSVKSLPSGPTMTTSATSPSLPAGVQLMNADLQRKLNSRAIQYNMKVVIRGDRNVGKTSLFRRIQGLDFIEEYVPTDQIQVAHIQWSYKVSDDTVKVEVWDVVDKGKPRQKLDGLKLSNEEKQLFASASLDAEFIDVYKGAHCVIFVFDITKLWTYEYVEREIQRVPAHLPVLILANHADQSHHRTVPKDRPRVFAETFASQASRPPGGPPIIVCEASMRNNFGLRFIHAFLGVPFLVMQRNTLATLMERNATELEAMHDELSAMLEDPTQSYEAFSEQLANKRREKADSLSPAVALEKAGAIAPTPPQPPPPPQPQMVAGLQVPPEAAVVVQTIKQTLGVATPVTTAPVVTTPTMVAMTGVGRGQPIVVPGQQGASSLNTTPTITTTTSKISPNSGVNQQSSNFPQQQQKNATPPVFRPSPEPKQISPQPKPPLKTTTGALGSVDDFVPDSGNVDSFLSDEQPKPAEKSPAKKSGGFMASVFGSKPKQPDPPHREVSKPPPVVVVESPPKPAPPKKPVIDSDDEDYSRPHIAGFSEDIDDGDMAVPVPPVVGIHNEEEIEEEPQVLPVQPPDFCPQALEDYDYADDDFINPPAVKLPSPRSSHSSSIQQPPTPPSFAGDQQRASSFADESPSLPVVGRTGSFASQNSYNHQQEEPANVSLPVPSAETPQEQQGQSSSPSSNRSRSSSSLQQQQQPELQQKVAVFTEEIEPETIRPRVESNESFGAEPVVPTLTDFDFALLEQRTMAKPPHVEPEPEVVAPAKKKTVKKSSAKSSGKKTEGKEVATKKSTSKTTGKAKTKKQTSLVAADDDGVEEAEEAKPAPVRHQVSAPGPPPHRGNNNNNKNNVVMEQNDEDDLESFLNS